MVLKHCLSQKQLIFFKIPKWCYPSSNYEFLDNILIMNNFVNLQDGLVETLRRTRVKFVHCLLPQHTAGCTENKSLLSVKSNQSEDNIINVPLLRSQVITNFSYKR